MANWRKNLDMVTGDCQYHGMGGESDGNMQLLKRWPALVTPTLLIAVLAYLWDVQSGIRGDIRHMETELRGDIRHMDQELRKDIRTVQTEITVIDKRLVAIETHLFRSPVTLADQDDKVE